MIQKTLLKVTVEEHAEIHRRLWEQFGRWQDHVAWKMLSGQITRQEAIRLAQSEGAKNRPKKFGKDNHFFGRQHTHESNEKNRQKHLGKPPSNKGLFGPDVKYSKLWKITEPDENIIIIKGLTVYCQAKGLSYQTMRHDVASGKQKQHRGYKCERVLNG